MAKQQKQPTPQQIDAYRLVYIHECTQSDAAKLMDCSQPNISLLLKNLKKSHPALFISKRPDFHILPLNKPLDSDIIRRF